MPSRPDAKPAKLAGLLWGLFSATAFLSAFTLPIHIWALMTDWKMKLDPVFFKFYFAVLFFSALYHGLYRLKTVLKDLKIL